MSKNGRKAKVWNNERDGEVITGVGKQKTGNKKNLYTNIIKYCEQ